MKKKYEGKYWKFDNSFEDEESWMYSFCKEELNDKEGMFNTLELGEKSTFTINTKDFFFLCQMEVTREEYVRELTKFKAKVLELV